jgi:hypothetical protein
MVVRSPALPAYEKKGARVTRTGSLAIRGRSKPWLGESQISVVGSLETRPQDTSLERRVVFACDVRREVRKSRPDSGQTDPESGAIGLGNNFKDCSSLAGASRLGRAPQIAV